MKWLVLIAVVLIVLWLLKPRRVRERPAASSSARGPLPENMVRCEHCGVHLPAGDALPGRSGVFCGEAHRAAHEASRER